MKEPRLIAELRTRILAERPSKAEIKLWAKMTARSLDHAIVLPGFLELVDGPIFRAVITALALEIMAELEEAEAKAQAVQPKPATQPKPPTP